MAGVRKCGGRSIIPRMSCLQISLNFRRWRIADWAWRPQRFIQGFDFPEAREAVCWRWNFPPRGGLGLASVAARLSRSARWIGVSASGGSLIPLSYHSFRFGTFIAARFARRKSVSGAKPDVCFWRQQASGTHIPNLHFPTVMVI